jgi:exodeoxyribonuclease VII small subunit
MSKKASDKSGGSGSAGGAGGGALTFEEAMTRLEGIVERVERGEIGLEDALKEYEEGMALIKRCKEVLGKAQQRVEELGREALRESERGG